jgi:hypothetical protein
MILELFPKALTLFPNQAQDFTARAIPPPPMWTSLTDGVVQQDYSLRLGLASQPFLQGSGAHQLVSGIGSIQFTINNLCKPSSTGEFRITIFQNAPTPWEYRVLIKLSTIEIRDQANTLLTTLSRELAVNDKVRIDIANTFRLFINDILQHEITSFASAIAYPATYTAKLTLPVVGTTGFQPTIPAPLLLGDWQLRPVVTFTTPTEGSLSTNGPALQTTYSNGDTPGAYKLVGQIDPGVDVYMEDAVPTGGVQQTQGGDAWTFVGSSPTPFSGTLCHKSSNVAGNHAHFFDAATATLQINTGDVVYCYVFPDTVNTTTEIMLEWKATDSTSFEHRAYWGANSLTGGTDGTASRRFMGALPTAGQWTRLEVPASLIDLEGRVVNGMSFRLFNGVCSWDQAGKIPGLQKAESLITIPPLQILGETVRTIQPGQKIRFATNYDQAPSPPTWSVVSGAGSFSQGEFTAATAPGTTVVRATAATGNQVADITITVPAVITPSYTAAAPSEVIDWDINILTMPYFVAAGAMAEGVGAIVPGLPLGIQANDILLLFVETANEAVTTPSGYAAVADSPQGTGTAGVAGSVRLSVFWKRASANETAPTVADPGDHAIGQILAFRGCIDTGNPWDVTSGDTAASSTSVSIPGDTTTVVNCLVVLAVANATDTATLQTSGYTNANLVNLTERADVNTTQGVGGGFAVATGEKAAIGAYAATTATLATASAQGRMSIALKPAIAVWTANAGSINSGTGQWTAPSVLGQTVTISVTNGTFTATRVVLIIPAFPFTDFSLPLAWDRNLTALISMSEDRTSRITRDKAPPFDSYPIKLTSRTLADCNTIDAFFDQQRFGKLFILEDKVRSLRKVGWFDSPIRHEARDECDIDLAFQFLEARL